LKKSEEWATLWVAADSKKCQIQMVQMTKKNWYTLSIIFSIPRENFSGTGGMYSNGQVFFLSDVILTLSLLSKGGPPLTESTYPSPNLS
jgi:hypothetical protein